MVLNEGLTAMLATGERLFRDNGTFECSGIKEIVLPGTLVQLGEDAFRYCDFLERVWVEQRCQIHIADFVESDVDVRVFQVGDEIPLNQSLDSTESDESDSMESMTEFS